MSKKNNWIPIDKNLIQEYKRLNRPLSRIEAMFSFTYDRDNNKSGSINGYAKQWQWSRSKTKKFINGITSSEGFFEKTSGRQLKNNLTTI